MSTYHDFQEHLKIMFPEDRHLITGVSIVRDMMREQLSAIAALVMDVSQIG